MPLRNEQLVYIESPWWQNIIPIKEKQVFTLGNGCAAIASLKVSVVGRERQKFDGGPVLSQRVQ
jgi:hypothetical protein